MAIKTHGVSIRSSPTPPGTYWWENRPSYPPPRSPLVTRTRESRKYANERNIKREPLDISFPHLPYDNDPSRQKHSHPADRVQPGKGHLPSHCVLCGGEDDLEDGSGLLIVGIEGLAVMLEKEVTVQLCSTMKIWTGWKHLCYLRESIHSCMCKLNVCIVQIF